ncbi:MAG: hypothetical protein GC155_13385 [Alphaproteobacteria bacterium]|nr:hypothetical protein [Alphaproteobacteria bacterium]
MIRRRFIPLFAALAMHASAWAADVRVEVRSPGGAPIANAVVTISGPATTTALPADGWVMEQKGLAFHPFVLVVPPGATVSFPNHDQTRHHVYSFSPAGPFELKLYGSGETRTVRFPKAGTIAIGCNIHDQMTAFIRVTDAPWAAVTDASGVATFHDVEAGDRSINVWHPYQKGAPDATLGRESMIPAAGSVTQTFLLSIRKPLDLHSAY